MSMHVQVTWPKKKMDMKKINKSYDRNPNSKILILSATGEGEATIIVVGTHLQQKNSYA